MITYLALTEPVSAYMIGTTALRVLVMLFGLLLVARLTPMSSTAKIAGVTVIAAALVGWTALLTLLGRNNVFRIDGTLTFPPPILIAVIGSIIAGYVAFRTWQPWREIVRHTPQHWLIGIQVFRITGGLLLLLYWRGSLPAEFAIPAGVGDVVVGLTAIPVAYFTYKRRPWSGKLATGWNYFGIIDFVIAVPLGILTSPSPIQLLALDNPNFLTTTYPVVLFPLFSVPVGIILHLYSLALLKREDKNPAREKTTAQSTAWRLMLFFAGAVFIYVIIFYLIIPFRTARPLAFQIDSALGQSLAARPIALYLHIVPAALAIILGPFQFLETLRARWLRLHRWLGRIYLFGILFGGLGGFYLALFSFAGIGAQLGFGLLAMVWLFSGYMAYTNIRQGLIEAHRAWMIRSYALTFAAVTLRFWTRSFFIFGLTLPDFHAVNAWLCWVPNLIFAEWLIYRGRSQPVEKKQVLRATET